MRPDPALRTFSAGRCKTSATPSDRLASSLIHVELVNDRRGGGSVDFQPDMARVDRLEANLLMKYSHRPVVERVCLRRPRAPSANVCHLLPATCRLNEQLRLADIGILTLVIAFEQDGSGHRPDAPKVELQPAFFSRAVGFPVCARVSVAHVGIRSRAAV